MRFSNKNVQLLGGNFYGRIFTRRELCSRCECYQDFASRQDSRRDPGEEFFLGGIPASTDFSVGFLPRYAAGIFPGKDAAGKTGHLGGIPAGSRWTPGILAESRRDPGTCFTREQIIMLGTGKFKGKLRIWGDGVCCGVGGCGGDSGGGFSSVSRDRFASPTCLTMKFAVRTVNLWIKALLQFTSISNCGLKYQPEEVILSITACYKTS